MMAPFTDSPEKIGMRGLRTFVLHAMTSNSVSPLPVPPLTRAEVGKDVIGFPLKLDDELRNGVMTGPVKDLDLGGATRGMPDKLIEFEHLFYGGKGKGVTRGNFFLPLD